MCLLIENEVLAMSGLIIAMASALIAIPAAWGAVKAIKYAKEAPSKKDLERVEGNTLRTSEHLEGVKADLARVEENTLHTSTNLESVVVDLARVEGNTLKTSEHLQSVNASIARMDALFHGQNQKDELQSRANRIPVSVRGQSDAGEPLRVSLRTTDGTAKLSRIALLNEQGNNFGYAACTLTDDVDSPNAREFVSILDSVTLQQWMNGGMAENYNRIRAGLRVYMYFGGHEEEVHRHMGVLLLTGSRRISANQPYPIIGTVEIHGSV